MPLNIPGLLGKLAGLPDAMVGGLLGPTPVNPQLGLDPQSIKDARQQAITDMSMGLIAGGKRPMALMGARQYAQEGFRGRVFDMLKEQEMLRMQQQRDKLQSAATTLAGDNPVYQQFASAAPDAFMGEAIKSAMAPGADGRTDDIKEYQMAVQQGFTGTLQDWINSQKAAGATRVSVSTSLPPSETELEKSLGKAAGEEFAGMSTAARGAISSLEQMNLLEPLVNSPGFISGPLGESRLAVAKVLGLPGATETQAYFAAVGKQVGENIKLFGAGTGLSDADREFAKQMAGGSIDLTPDAIKRIMRINRTVAEDIVGKYNKRRYELAHPEGKPIRDSVLSLYPELRAPSAPNIEALVNKYAPRP